MNRELLKNQIIPLALTLVVALLLGVILYGEIITLNHFTEINLSTALRWGDVLVGMTIYLKTSIDFAIFIARLMRENVGWKNRIAIEIGTAAGNAFGTLAILLLWSLFHQVTWLLAIMIVIAALVLFRLAEEGLEHASGEFVDKHPALKKFINGFEKSLRVINKIFNPVLKYIIPRMSTNGGVKKTFWALLKFSFIIPFILGLDDFAGYVPLFSVVNVFGFAIGVFLGHMILNALLFISPSNTMRAIKNPIISLIGSIAFVLLAIWGFKEAIHLFLH